jgi:hypothetical protein
MIRFTILTTLAMALAMEGRAGLLTSMEVVETMSQSAESALIFTGTVFGADAFSTLNFAASYDPNAKTFSYDTLPGQTYQGQAFSMATTGSYNSGLGEYQFTTVASLGSQTWTGAGTDMWVGDPTANINTTYVYKGVTYTVTGAIPVDVLGHSEGTLTYTSPSGESYLWPSTDFVPGSPTMPITVNANGFEEHASIDGSIPFGGGLGAFSAEITPSAVPEPSAVLPVLGGLLCLFSRIRKFHRGA